MGMTTEQVLNMARFMDAVQEAAVESGISFVSDQRFFVNVTDGEGGENVAMIETAEKRDSSECDVDWWLELRSIS